MLFMFFFFNPMCSNIIESDCTTPADKARKNTATLLIAVIVPVVAIILMLILWMLCCKGEQNSGLNSDIFVYTLYSRAKWIEPFVNCDLAGKSKEHDDYDIYEEDTPLHTDTRRFTYTELKTITNNFQSIIGKGGFGMVYHGILDNGEEVAVKVLRETSITLSKDFLPEVNYQTT